MTVLLTAPNYDEATSYLYAYAKDLVKDFECIFLERPRLTKKNLKNILEKKKPLLVLFHGHGNPTMIFGDDDELLIKEGENHSILKIFCSFSLLPTNCQKSGSFLLPTSCFEYVY